MSVRTKTTHTYVCNQCDRTEVLEVDPNRNADHERNLPEGWSRLEVLLTAQSAPADSKNERAHVCSKICAAKHLQMIGDIWERAEDE